MPCPEREVWGGVLKRKLLLLYGAQQRNALLGRLAPVLLPIALGYVRLRYRQIARRVVDEIADYIRSGFTVVGIVGIDGSPTCGVNQGIDVRSFVRDVSRVDLVQLTAREQNALVRRHAIPGRGLFMEELARQLAVRHLDVPLLAHDLLAELDGRPSDVAIGSEPSLPGDRPSARGREASRRKKVRKRAFARARRRKRGENARSASYPRESAAA